MTTMNAESGRAFHATEPVRTSTFNKINRFLAFDQTYYVKEISAPPSGKWGLSGKIYSVKFS